LWQQYGAATAQVVVTSLNLPDRSIQWSDDWSQPHERFRRDPVDSSGPQISVIGSAMEEGHVLPNGTKTSMRRDNDIVVLAPGYPAPALMLSLSKHQCIFHTGKDLDPRMPPPGADSDDVAVTENCPDPLYPGSSISLTWTFSRTSGLPKSVELPMWSQMYYLVRPETVTYQQFMLLQGCLVPAALTIRRVTGVTEVLTVNHNHLLSSLPEQTFQTALSPGVSQ
jgi:hypothetical protein